MARRTISEETAANEMYAKFGKEGIREKWHRYALAHKENDDISNVEEYIEKYEPKLTEWLESLIPYLPNFCTIDNIIADYFRGEYYLSDLKK